MKSSKLLIVCALFLLLTPAFAQTSNGKAWIPFDFSIGDQTLSAGYYRVTVDGVRLQLSRIDGPDAAAVFTITTKGDRDESRRARLLFHRYGNQLFLAEAWMGKTETGNRLFPSKTELRLTLAAPQTGETVAMVREKK